MSAKIQKGPIVAPTFEGKFEAVQEKVAVAPLVPELSSGGLPVTTVAATSGQKRLGGQLGAESLPGPGPAGAHTLRLKNQAGVLVEIKASNYYLDASGQARPWIKGLAETALSRDPAEQLQRNQALTSAHAKHEMSFRVKDPETGHYDKIFEVPVHGTPIPIQKSHFDKLTRSTAPVMRALRDMLRAVYSKPELTAKDLGIEDLPKEDKERILGSIQESVYFEPKLRAPAMKDYPFLTVAGFDAALGDLDKQNTIFFEYNLGTPSGLSNNVQLMEELRRSDPELYATIQDRIPKDETFAILKRAIDSNALSWTQNKEGISVVVSPGVANGAHPDVASIAMFSGMPLVNPSDLYTDKDGTIRLNTGRPGPHPAVTGIYGRAEESYFLQNSADGIPIRSPERLENPALGEKLGVKLEPGVEYAFLFNDKDEIVGVRKDAEGRPLLQEIYESMGRDPGRPEAPPGSFAQAILGKKLYYSGLGGRVVDDKRVFQAIAEHVAKKYVEVEDAPIARPPRTLRKDEYAAFYQSEHLENYVVKEPDKSGGDGVFLMVNLPAARRQEIVAAVKAHPGRYIIQEFADSAVAMSVEPGPGNQPIYGSLANDVRLFSIMDGQGQVDAGPNSLLLRVAKPYSASTNTSQGAGYGIGLVLGEPGEAPKGSLLPSVAPVRFAGASRLFDLREFIGLLNRLTAATTPGSPPLEPGWGALLADDQRKVMDLLGRDYSPFMSLARAFDRGEIDRGRFHRALIDLRNQLFEARELAVADLTSIVRAELSQYVPPIRTVPAGRAAASRAALEAQLSATAIDPPWLAKQGVLDGRAYDKVETRVYTASKEPAIAAAIKELSALGGSLREIRLRDPKDGSWRSEAPASYFRVDASGVPVIGLDLSQELSLTTLAHELEHFRLWSEWRQRFLDAGEAPLLAAKHAQEKTLEPAERVAGERRALSAEMKAEADARSIFNRGAMLRPREPWESAYVARLTYPEVDGIRALLHEARWNDKPLDRAQLKEWLGSAMRFALENRRRAQAMIQEELQGAHGTRHAELISAQHALEHRSLFASIFDAPPLSSLDEFRTDGTLSDLREAFWEVYGALPVEQYQAHRDAPESLTFQQQQQQQ